MVEFFKKSFTDVNFNIDLAMHMLILFTFLSVFFAFYITKLSKQAFNDKKSHLIHSSLKDKVEKVKKNPDIKNILEKLPLDKLIKIYSEEHKTIKAKNDGLLNTVGITNVLLWVNLISVILILKYVCKSELDIGHIVKTNAIIFIFIGAVEFAFFKFIALKFIPVEPSFISKQFIELTQSELRNN